MKKLISFVIFFIFIATIAHMATLRFVPGFVMNKALETLEERGAPLHVFTSSPRITPQTQTVVRPSPDLAYALCPYDLKAAENGVRIRAARSKAYGSVSFYDANTNNFATFRLDEPTSQGLQSFHLSPPNAIPAIDDATTAVISPTTRGVILIRRLAPTSEAHAETSALGAADLCAPA